MKKAIWLGALFAVVAGSVAWKVSKTRPTPALSRQEIGDRVLGREAKSKVRDVAAEKGISSGSLAVAPVTPPEGAVAAAAAGRVDPRVASQLSGFQQLHEKVFLSASDESEKKNLLMDSQFIRMSADVLKNVKSMEDPEFEKSQNSAMDALLEALKSGNQAAAHTAITELILDPQVEDPALPMPIRKTLAGIKAELLYHATALDPQGFSRVVSNLPGPVSGQIWKNVQERQDDNVAESRAEILAQQRNLGK